MNTVKNKISREDVAGKAYTYRTRGYRFISVLYYKKSRNLMYMFEKEESMDGFLVECSEGESLNSIIDIYMSAYYYEQKIQDENGIVFIRQDGDKQVEKGISEVPLGPQHPLIFEPVKFWVRMKNEKVRDVSPVMGYTERNISSFVIGNKWDQALSYIERISSRSGFTYGTAFCHAIELINDIAVPQKFQYLRLIGCEFNRIVANIYALSCISQCLGAEKLSSTINDIHQQTLEAAAVISQEQNLFSLLTIGGMKSDVPKDTLLKAGVILREMENKIKYIYKEFSASFSIQRRLKGLAPINDSFLRREATGAAAKGNGIAMDLRRLSFLPYEDLDFNPYTIEGGDCLSRTLQMVSEIKQSIELIEQAASTAPKPEVAVKPVIKKSGEVIVVTEEPAGRFSLYLSIDTNGKINDFTFRSASLNNLPLAAQLMKGQEFADILLILYTMNISFSSIDL